MELYRTPDDADTCEVSDFDVIDDPAPTLEEFLGGAIIVNQYGLTVKVVDAYLVNGTVVLVKVLVSKEGYTLSGMHALHGSYRGQGSKLKLYKY